MNLPSENYKLKEKEYNWLSSKLAEDGMIISLLDFDATGRTGAKYLKDTYDIPYIFITRGEFGLPNYECKDFADLHEKFNNKQIDNFINETIRYVELRYKKIYTIQMPFSKGYHIVSFNKTNRLCKEIVVMTSISKEEEDLLDEGKDIKIDRGNRTFTVQAKNFIVMVKLILIMEVMI